MKIWHFVVGGIVLGGGYYLLRSGSAPGVSSIVAKPAVWLGIADNPRTVVGAPGVILPRRGWNPGVAGAPPAAPVTFVPGATTGPTLQARRGAGAF